MGISFIILFSLSRIQRFLEDARKSELLVKQRYWKN